MTSTKSLPGKQALVTGSTSGIGLGIARVLALAGCNLTLNGFGEASAIEALRAGLAEEAGVEVVRDVMLAAQPTRRLITIDQVADLTVYLCTDSASAITGAVLPIDGGWTAK